MDRSHLFLIFILLAIKIDPVSGQDLSRFNQLSIDIGVSHDRFIDEAYTNNRLKYTGTNFLFSTSWEKLVRENYWGLSFEGSKGSVHNSTTGLDANLLYGRLSARYGRPILKSLFQNSPQQAIAAIELSTSNYLIEDILDDTWYTGNVTFTSNHILSLVFNYSRLLNKKNKLTGTLVLPVCGWVKRINYEDGVNQEAEKAWQEARAFDILFEGSNFRFSLPWELLHFKVFYSHPMSPNIQWIVSYQFRYVNNREIQPITLYANCLSTGFTFNLNKKEK